jgi:hypothetical protein
MPGPIAAFPSQGSLSSSKGDIKLNANGKILKPLQIFLAASALLVASSAIRGQAASSGQRQENQGSAPPFSLKIDASEHVFKVGAKIVVQITYKSTSDHLIIVPATPRDSSFDVRDVQGNGVPLRKPRPIVTSPPTFLDKPAGNGRGKAFGPGESVTENDDVGEIFDMSLPGKYTIQALHFWPPDNTWVKSNTITITVTQ